ncbi:galactosylceramide sulfotransferase-like [Branchiostoma lanceolatum]|uniref:galactosylceramide sulfotransferase-like n=1 Tax=Branchiostoma lanceolatum TaxID=7740 RepID=UPI0034554AE1
MDRGPILRQFCGLILIAVLLLTLYGVLLFTTYSNNNKRLSRQSSECDTTRLGPSSDTDSNAKYVPPTCTPRTNIALAKLHKTGGTTLMQILHRLAYLKNLSIVVPTSPGRNSINLFYPRWPKPDKYLPPQSDRYNMFTFHSYFNRTILAKLLGDNTNFVTILREPLSHLRSQFNFYWMAKYYKLKGPDPILRFLENPGKYDHRRPGYRGTRNPMAGELGIDTTTLIRLTQQSMDRPPGQPMDASAVEEIQSFLDKISKEMDLVMILEYVDESLVVLKRLMCWQLPDIIYYKMLALKYAAKETEIPSHLVENHRKWDLVDYELYGHFNRTLWKKVSEEDGIREEIVHFKDVNLKVQEHCSVDDLDHQRVLTIEESRWNAKFTVTHEFCSFLKFGQMCYVTLLRDRNIRYRMPNERKLETKTQDNRKDLYSKRYCELCDEISRDCTLNDTMGGVPIFRLFRGMLLLAVVTVLLYGAILFQRHNNDRVVRYNTWGVRRSNLLVVTEGDLSPEAQMAEMATDRHRDGY